MRPDNYTATVNLRGTILEELLTNTNVACNSDYLMWSPGGSRSPVNFVPDGSYSGYPQDPWVYFEFFSPVCISHLYVEVCEKHSYPTCVFYGSNDKINWEILLDRSGQSSGAYGDLYPDTKKFYRFFKFNLVSSSRWGYLQYLRLYGYYLNKRERTCTNLNKIAVLTASGLEDGSTINNITNDDGGSSTIVTPDENGRKWIKWELEEPCYANIFRFDFQRWEGWGKQATRFKLEGSEDNEVWELLLERNSLDIHFQNNHSVYWYLVPEKPYKFYRLTCCNVFNEGYENWQLYGAKIYQLEDGCAAVQKIVPKMESASQNGFEASASSTYADDHAAYYAFDDDPNTRWGASKYNNQWLQIKLADPAVVNAIEMRARVCCPIQMPKSFAILGSNDGESFAELFATEDTKAWQSSEKRTCTFDNTTPYLYYRLKINSSHDGQSIALSCLNFGTATREYKRELHIFDYVVPVLSGDETTTDEGVYKLSSSSEHSSHKRYSLFDRSYDSRFETDGTPDGWIQVELPVAKVVNYYQVGSRSDSWCNAAPRNYSLLASNDGATWTTLLSVESETPFGSSELREHPVTNSAAYTFYRLEFSNGNRGNTLTFARWDLVFKDEIKEY